MEFVETVTLTRENYDELKVKIYSLTEFGKIQSNCIKKYCEENEKLKEYIFDVFVDNHKYTMDEYKTAQEYLDYYFGEGTFGKYQSLQDILGYPFIKEKVEQYYDSISEKSED